MEEQLGQITRLITIVRDDINPGYQLAQSLHAISQFSLEHSDLFKQWNNSYIVSLSIPSEEKLSILADKLTRMGIPMSYFTEPDIQDQLTAISFIETDKTKKLTSHLPLALSKYDKRPISSIDGTSNSKLLGCRFESDMGHKNTEPTNSFR